MRRTKRPISLILSLGQVFNLLLKLRVTLSLRITLTFNCLVMEMAMAMGTTMTMMKNRWVLKGHMKMERPARRRPLRLALGRRWGRRRQSRRHAFSKVLFRDAVRVLGQ